MQIEKGCQITGVTNPVHLRASHCIPLPACIGGRTAHCRVTLSEPSGTQLCQSLHRRRKRIPCLII
jgi:hypothetical protein